MRLCSWFAGVDFDSRYLTAVLGCASDDRPPHVLGARTVDLQSVNGTRWDDRTTLHDAIRGFTEWFHLESGGALNAVAIAMPGDALQEIPSSGSVDLDAPGFVDDALLDLARRRACEAPRRIGTVVTSVERGYELDGRRVSGPPQGQAGRSIRLELISWIARPEFLEPIADALGTDGFAADLIVPRIVAVGQAALSDLERRDGALVVSIGDTMSEVSVFAGFSLVDLFVVPIGRRALIAELARMCRLSTAVIDRLDLGLMIDRVPSDPLVGRVRMSLSAWGTALFSFVRRRLDERGLGWLLQAGVVIAASPQFFPSLDQSAARMLGVPARFATADGRLGKESGSRTAPFAALGLIPMQWSAQLLEAETDDVRETVLATPRLAAPRRSNGRGGIGQALGRWLREFVPVEHG